MRATQVTPASRLQNELGSVDRDIIDQWLLSVAPRADIKTISNSLIGSTRGLGIRVFSIMTRATSLAASTPLTKRLWGNRTHGCSQLSSKHFWKMPYEK